MATRYKISDLCDALEASKERVSAAESDQADANLALSNALRRNGELGERVRELEERIGGLEFALELHDPNHLLLVEETDCAGDMSKPPCKIFHPHARDRVKTDPEAWREHLNTHLRDTNEEGDER